MPFLPIRPPVPASNRALGCCRIHASTTKEHEPLPVKHLHLHCPSKTVANPTF